MNDRGRRLLAGLVGVGLGISIPSLNFTSPLPWILTVVLAIAFIGAVAADRE